MPTPITVAYDLDEGTLEQQTGRDPDEFLSGAIRFEPVTLSSDSPDDRLEINVDFAEEETGAGQQIELRTLGTGFDPQVPLPTTFTTVEGQITGHDDFGPGIVVSGEDLTGFEGMNARLILSEVTDRPALSNDTLESGAIAGHGGRDAFEFFFIGETHGGHPDLLDDPHEPLRFGGFKLELDYQGPEPSVTLDSLDFNLLSAEIGILRSPPEFEVKDDPLGEVFIGDDNANSFGGTDGYDLFIGKGGDDFFAGQDGPDVAYGDAGDDILDLGRGQNTAFGGGGNDIIQAQGIGGSQIQGGPGDDDLTGSFDNDVILGGDGEDRIESLYGNDVLTGGDDADIFAFQGDLRIAFRGVGDDVITDFQNGLDKIEIDAFFTPGAGSFAELAPNIADGPDGAVLTIPDEGTITFAGTQASVLDGSDFVFA